MDLKEFDLIIINSSGGKDSIAALFSIWKMAQEQDFPAERIHVSHQDLGRIEWKGTTDLARRQAEMFGYAFHTSKYWDKDKNELDLLQYVEKRGLWPGNGARYCTSDFKRGPGSRVVTRLSREHQAKKVLYVFGFRAQESPARAKKKRFVLDKRLTTKSREVYEFNPVLDWTERDVWACIKGNAIPYHEAYDLGMPRLSCAFCVFAGKDALVIAGRHNPELLEDYIATEEKIGHKFRQDFAIAEVRDLIASGYNPKKAAAWKH